MFSIRQTEEFVVWLDALKDMRAQVRIAARLRQAEGGNLGDWSPSKVRYPSSASTTAPATGSTSCAAGA